MASRGYMFETEDGRSFAVPSPGVLLSPVRASDGYPDWFADYTAGRIRNIREFGGDIVYTLELLDDGTLEFRDVDIDTLMYTMVPTYDASGAFAGYDVAWDEYTVEELPDRCGAENGVLLPVDGGDSWSEFSIDFDHVALPVYGLEYKMMELTEGAGEEEVVEYNLAYFLDLTFAPEPGSECALWEYGGRGKIAFNFGEGKDDTLHRRVYALDGIDCSVLPGDDGFVLHDGAGDRIGNAAEYLHDDDESFDDGWGVATLSSVALDAYLEAYPLDGRRVRSESLRREVWDASVDAQANPLDKLMLIIRMRLDADIEWRTETWPIEMPPNCVRRADDAGVSARSTKSGWEVDGQDGGKLYEVVRSGEGDGTSWTFYGGSGDAEYIVRPVGDGTFEAYAADGTVVYEIAPKEHFEDFELNGEYSPGNLYPALEVAGTGGASGSAEVPKPERADDPFDSLTFAEFADSVPLRKVDGAWVTYAGDPKWYASDSTSSRYWQDVYSSWNVLKYRVAKTSEWDEDDREVYDIDGNLVAIWTADSLVSAATGELVAKMYADPEALYSYQLFDNAAADYLYLTHYGNGLVVVLDRKGYVYRYVAPNGELRGATWHLYGTVGDDEVLDPDGEVLYTFRQRSGDWNIYGADGAFAGHLYSASEPNNEWVIAEGCQRLFTFLAPGTSAVVSSDGTYVFTGEDGSTVESRIQIQAEETGLLVLTVLDADGEEMYRVSNTGSAYQINAANGVAFDTAVAYETQSQGNIVLTRYWSTPYNRMMYSCTNDQAEGTFDGSDSGDAEPASAGVHAYASSVGGVAGRSVSGTVARLFSDAGVPRTLAAESTSSSSGDSSSAPLDSPDSIQDLIDTMSDFYDGVNGVLAKDTNTSKGDDLDPENPLAIAQTETDGRLIADACFSSGSRCSIPQLHALQDAYDYTQAVTRISKVYSQNRADLYKEAQDYAATRTKRIEAKKSAFLRVMNNAKSLAEKMKS